MSDSFRKLLQALEGFKDQFNNQSFHDQNCTVTFTESKVSQWMLIPAALIVIIIVLATPDRSRKRLKFCLPNPMNILESREHHFVFLMAFISASSFIVAMLYDPGSVLPIPLTSVPAWSSVLINVIASMLYGACYYPIFVCISAKTLLGYILGFLYQSGMFITYIIQLSECPMRPLDAALLSIFVIPSAACKFGLFIYFGYKGFHLCRNRRRNSETGLLEVGDTVADYDIYCLQYVRNIFIRGLESKNLTEEGSECCNKQELSFIFSPRFLSTIAASFVLTTLVFYYLINTLILYSNVLIDVAWNGLPDAYKNGGNNTYVVFNRIFGQESGNEITEFDFLYLVYYALQTFQICAIVSMITPLLVSWLHCVQISTRFRDNMLNLYWGKKQMVTPIRDMHTGYALVGCLRYSGYQMGFMVWGFLLQAITLLILTNFLAFFFVIPAINNLDGLWKPFLVNVMPTMAFSFTIYYTQLFLAQKYFLANPGQTMYVNHRNHFFIFNYFIFFYNIILGLISCLYRLFLSLMFGLILLGRLDWSVLPYKHQNYDSGHTAYLGFLHIEHAHTNPTMRAFLKLLSDSHIQSDCDDLDNLTVNEDEIEDEIEASYERIRDVNRHSREQRARTRWHLVYTLLRNPTIRAYRRKNKIFPEYDNENRLRSIL